MTEASSATWAERRWPGPDFFHAVWGDGVGSVWAVGQVWGGATGIARSQDWGESWAPEPRPGQQDLYAVHGDGAGTLLAAGMKGTLLRHDGKAWKRVRAGLKENLLAAHARPGGELYAGAASGAIHRSADGGKTWAQVRAGPGGGGDRSIRCFASAPGGPLLAGGCGRTLLRSDDGLRWAEVPVELPAERSSSGEQLGCALVLPGGGALVGAWDGQLLLCDDGRWRRVALPGAEVERVTGVAAAGDAWLAATLGQVFRSADRGRSWAVEYRRPLEAHAWNSALWADPGGRAVAVGTHGTLRQRTP